MTGDYSRAAPSMSAPDLEVKLMSDGRLLFQPRHLLAGCILGRSDDQSDYQPDVDLAGFAARERGVSRRHVALVVFEATQHVVDLSSVNGTFINGKRIAADTPHPLKVGDELRLGNLTLLIAAGD